MEEVRRPASSAEEPQTPLTPGLIRLMAASCGMSVANMYYCQPLLAQMRGTFHVTMPQISAVPIVTQLGCAAGMLLFVPMGDIRERRRLILQLLMAVTLALSVACAAPGLGWILAASLAIGVTSVVPHLIIPFAAQTGPPGRERPRCRERPEWAAYRHSVGPHGRRTHRRSVWLAGDVRPGRAGHGRAGARLAAGAAAQRTVRRSDVRADAVLPD